ncbi:MAG: hypothetical protein CFE21_00945 [Bacteroidetes bacterium B1(2017)]|nr:MAG: hypothetical protein CFE21_00945 [Bacteroidetes bacterium B1(2017)]
MLRNFAIDTWQFKLTHMKKHLQATLLFLGTLFIFAASVNAQTTCTANYTKAILSGTQTVNFTSTSTPVGNYFYFWNFGDGTTSNLANPSKVYANGGHYLVCLTIVKTDSTCTSTKCDSLIIAGNTTPTCNANWSKQVDPNNSLKNYFIATLNDTSFRYFWTFGDGGVSDAKTTFHTYAHSGRYKVCLKVTKKDSTCTQTICDSITITAPATCNANWTKQVDPNNSLKNYFIATLNDTSFRYYWTFGDGGVSDAKTTFHTYLHSGRYKVCLKVTKKDSTCTQTVCDSITITALVTCNANWTKQIDPLNTLKNYFTATLNDTNYRYNWTFGDGSSSDNRTPNHTYPHSGKYKVCLKVTKKDSTCTQTICDSINVETASPCAANFNVFKSDSVGSNPHYIRFANTSTGTTTRCIYTFGDGTSSDNCNPVHYYSTLGSHTACLTIYNIHNSDTLCKSTICKTFTNATSSSISCIANFSYERIGTTNNYRFVNHSTGSPLVYTWVFDGGPGTHTTNAEHNFSSPGLHSICLTVKNTIDTTCQNTYCVGLMTTGLITQSSCVAEYDIQTSQTDPNTFAFISLAGSNFSNNWNFGDGTTSGEANTTHTYLKEGSYYVCLSVVSPTDSCSDIRCDSVSISGTTGVKQVAGLVSAVYPNPMETNLTIELNLPKTQETAISILDLNGKQVLLETHTLKTGKNTLNINVNDLSKGIYLLRISSGDTQINKKIIKNN